MPCSVLFGMFSCGDRTDLSLKDVLKSMLNSMGLPGQQDDESDLEDGDGSDGDDDEDAESADEEGAQLIPARADRLPVC